MLEDAEKDCLSRDIWWARDVGAAAQIAKTMQYMPPCKADF